MPSRLAEKLSLLGEVIAVMREAPDERVTAKKIDSILNPIPSFEPGGDPAAFRERMERHLRSEERRLSEIRYVLDAATMCRPRIVEGWDRRGCIGKRYRLVQSLFDDDSWGDFYL